MCSCCEQTTEGGGCCSISLKTVVYLLNAICWVAGGFLVYVGVEFLTSAGDLNEVTLRPPIIVFSTAAVILIGGVVGCYGVYSQKKACLSIYLVFVTSVLIVMTAVAGIMIAKQGSAERGLLSVVQQEFKQYNNNSEISTIDDQMNVNSTQFIDNLQQKLHCCGYNNYSDWQTLWNNSSFVPTSCCKSSTNETCTGNVTEPDTIYLQGCKEPVSVWISFLYELFQWSSFGMAVLCLLALIAVIVFLCTDRTTAYYYSTLSPGYTEA